MYPKAHTICLTVDIDPDGLSGKVNNRDAMGFAGFEAIHNFHEIINKTLNINVPITWFVRADEQIKLHYDDELYLFKRYAVFWKYVESELHHEIGWHPHLYEIKEGKVIGLLSDETKLVEEVKKISKKISKLNLTIKSFRNGESWMTPLLMDTVEGLGFMVDSTAIPGRADIHIPLRNWTKTPYSFYYPDLNYSSYVGAKRKIIEAPMTSWIFKTSYDTIPKVRYINPAIKTELFKKGINYINNNWEKYENCNNWVFITHPEEIAPQSKEDILYGFSQQIYADNVLLFKEFLNNRNIDVYFKTITNAVNNWSNANSK